ncbi:MAG: hypothetical protein ACLVJ6_03900 [Merdibacter sp.]
MNHQLSMGHARALLGLSDEKQMEELARQVVREQLSVRAVEKLVKEAQKPKAKKKKSQEIFIWKHCADVWKRVFRRPSRSLRIS